MVYNVIYVYFIAFKNKLNFRTIKLHLKFCNYLKINYLISLQQTIIVQFYITSSNIICSN